MIKLIGILIVGVGFALRFNTLLVVMAAGIVTGLVAGMSFNEIMELFGKYFVENRYMLLPIVLMVPLIGLLERHGLQERAEMLIKRTKSATAGRVILLYTAVRQITVALGINLGSSGGAHASFVRPLVAPMAEAAARARHGELPAKTVQLILANAAAAENTGNFFGEDVFIAVGAILLMKGFFDALDMNVSVWAMALWGMPTALVAFAIMAWRTHVLDRRIVREVAEAATKTNREGVK
jgi:uncharacterized membrane protein